MASLSADAAPREVSRPFRHHGWVRLSLWLNASSILLLIATGILILGAHRELYWGETGFFGDPAVLTFAHRQFDPIGVDFSRSTHFVAAWIFGFASLAYLLLDIPTGHLSRRILPSAEALKPASLVREIADHAPLRHIGHDQLDYNPLQKLACIFVVFAASLLMLFISLAMSPEVMAAAPWLIDLFGGRRSARTLQFFGVVAIVVFLLIQLWQVWLVGWRREIMVMVTRHGLTLGDLVAGGGLLTGYKPNPLELRGSLLEAGGSFTYTTLRILLPR
jgi:thiosulfate reductase cytochrome b subunit